MGVRRLGVYYAFWAPIILIVLALEIAWRWALLRRLDR